MSKRNLVISLSTSWTNAFAAEFEYAKNQLDAGNEVVVLGCSGGIERCLGKLVDNSSGQCQQCLYRRRVLYSHLNKSKGFTYIELPVAQVKTPLVSMTIDQVVSFEVSGKKFGLAALSTLIFLDRKLPRHGAAPAIALELIRSSISVYEAVSSFIRDAQLFDDALVFNGRFADTYGALTAVRDNNLSYTTYETLGSDKKYVTFYNATPHSLEAQTKRAAQYLENIQSQPALINTGRAFFEQKRRGNHTNDHPYITRDYTPFVLPDKFVGRKIISIFNSSEDEIRYTEYASNYGSLWFENQFDAIKQIVQAYSKDSSCVIVLRIHPNVDTGDPKDLEELLSLYSDNLITIQPTQKISSYSLLDQSHAVISFISTIGVEATYWRVPSISLSPNPYANVGGSKLVTSLHDLINILDSDMAPSNQDSAIAYGAMLMDGIAFKYIEGTYPTYWYGKLNISDVGAFKLESQVFNRLYNIGIRSSIAHFVATLVRPLSVLKKFVISRSKNVR
jgi:hypothetical protein